MTIESAEITGFRNLLSVRYVPCRGVNLICGGNAMGKTSLMEALYLPSSERNFRGAKDGELINRGSETASVYIEYTSSGTNNSVGIGLNRAGRGKLSHNRIKTQDRRRISENYLMCAFSPDDLTLAGGEPAQRRRYMDVSLLMLSPKYGDALSTYQKALKNRNLLLKGENPHSDMIFVYNDIMAKSAAYVINSRKKLTDRLFSSLSPLYAELSGRGEEFTVIYEPAVEGMTDMSTFSLYEYLNEKYTDSIDNDVKCGFTSIGPHRDELTIKINGLPARTHGSQGQKRSAALTLKLGQAGLIEELKGEPPVLILDDVLSELDEKRQEFILSHLGDMQVFITCCDRAVLDRLPEGTMVVRMSDGEIG